MKVDLRTAKVLTAEKVPNSRKLVKMRIDAGSEQRTLVAGISEAYKPEQLVGRTVVMVFNLKPAKLMGIESNGMVLAASPDGGKPLLVGFDQDVPPGMGSVGAADAGRERPRDRGVHKMIDSHCHLAGAEFSADLAGGRRAGGGGGRRRRPVHPVGRRREEGRRAARLRACGRTCGSRRHPPAPGRASRPHRGGRGRRRASRARDGRWRSGKSGSTTTTTSRRARCSRRSSARRLRWRGSSACRSSSTRARRPTTPCGSCARRADGRPWRLSLFHRRRGPWLERAETGVPRSRLPGS